MTAITVLGRVLENLILVARHARDGYVSAGQGKTGKCVIEPAAPLQCVQLVAFTAVG